MPINPHHAVWGCAPIASTEQSAQLTNNPRLRLSFIYPTHIEKIRAKFSIPHRLFPHARYDIRESLKL